MVVAHTTTREAYIVRRGSPPTDIDGNEIDIGTSVQILDSPSRRSAPNGTIAVVRGWHREDYSFAALEVPNPHDDLHDCDGLCQAARGLWVQDNRFIKFDPLPDDKGADEVAKQMATSLTDKSSVVIMGGRVFDLKLVENADLSKSLDTILESCAQQISAVIRRANAQECRLRAELKGIFQFPAFSLKHIQQGMQVCLWDGFLCYILPFSFAPRFVRLVESTEVESAEAVLVISDEHQKRLKTNVFLAITLDKLGNIIHAGLFKDPQLTEPFNHYHGRGEDCLGSIKGRVIKNPEEAISFRNKYQVVLQTVNMHSPMNKTCKNIGLDKLQEDSRPMKEGETWRTRKSPKEGAPPKVGDRVRVVRLVDLLTTSELGRIGTIRNIRGESNYSLQVEFDEPLHCGHNCSGYAPSGRGYNLPVSCVEIIEDEAEEEAATSTVTGSTTEPDAGWQTDTSDPPADEPDEERI